MAGSDSSKRPVKLSLTARNVEAAKALGINMPAVVDQAITDAIAQCERGRLQERMDKEMERFNAWSAQGVSVADEFGPLISDR